MLCPLDGGVYCGLPFSILFLPIGQEGGTNKLSLASRPLDHREPYLGPVERSVYHRGIASIVTGRTSACGPWRRVECVLLTGEWAPRGMGFGTDC